MGLDAQRTVTEAFIASMPGATLLCPIYTETQTGVDNDRPVLTQAIARCHQTGATVLQRQLDHACGTDATLPPGLTLKPCEAHK